MKSPVIEIVLGAVTVPEVVAIVKAEVEALLMKVFAPLPLKVTSGREEVAVRVPERVWVVVPVNERVGSSLEVMTRLPVPESATATKSPLP
jgi:hypothetical protein